MWKLGLRSRYSFFGNICFEISVFCLCSAPVSLIPVVHLDLRISPRFSTKFAMTLVLFSGAWGKMSHEKNQKQKTCSRSTTTVAALSKVAGRRHLRLLTSSVRYFWVQIKMWSQIWSVKTNCLSKETWESLWLISKERSVNRGFKTGFYSAWHNVVLLRIWTQDTWQEWEMSEMVG